MTDVLNKEDWFSKYKRLGKLVRVYDKSHLNTIEDVESLKMHAFYLLNEETDALTVWKVKCSVLHGVKWRRHLHECETIEFHEFSVRSGEDNIIDKVSVEKILREFGSPGMRRVWEALMRFGDYHDTARHLGLSYSTICNWVDHIRRLVKKKDIVRVK